MFKKISFIRDAWRIAKPYWQSEEKFSAWVLLISVVALNLFLVYLLVLFNEWYRLFYDALQNLDKEAFFYQIIRFCILAFINIMTFVLEYYLQYLLMIRWRRWLTAKYVKWWLTDKAYYKMQLFRDGTDNPDQRISQDLNEFVLYTFNLGIGLMTQVITLVSFAVVLWGISGILVIPIFGGISIQGYMMWAAIFYAIFGTYMTLRIGFPLIGLDFNQEKLEANFRYSLVRLRENTEGIALYGGEASEELKFGYIFRDVVTNLRAIMKRSVYLGCWTNFYNQLARIFPALVAAPRVFAKEILLGGMMQIVQAFGHVHDSLSFIVDTYPNIAKWRAVIQRLQGFNEDIERMQDLTSKLPHSLFLCEEKGGKGIRLDNVDVDLPGEKPLLPRVNLLLKKGVSVLVSGPSGAGKSTFLRVLAGIWPFGTGKVYMPTGDTTMFLPQKPYLPIGTLRATLVYPQQETSLLSEDILKAVIRDCGLEQFEEHLDDNRDWTKTLSLGEQQRVAMARAILLEPDWLFLDEATSALDEPSEKTLYTLLKDRLPKTTLISVGHRSTIRAFHESNLVFQPTGEGHFSLQYVEKSDEAI
ncbi:MAG: ABC transporter ATP-binding protein/permease [Alphaproteobacteria bacterium]|nr:ABC transporter ATP-binding protein/permease [Alphaproteobacteria bacterium]